MCKNIIATTIQRYTIPDKNFSFLCKCLKYKAIKNDDTKILLRFVSFHAHTHVEHNYRLLESVFHTIGN